jgi:hypothetical protein
MSKSIYIIGVRDLNAQCIIKDLISLNFNIYVNKEEYEDIEESIKSFINIYKNEKYDILLLVNDEPISFERNMLVLHISDKEASFFINLINHIIYDEEYRNIDSIPIIDIDNNIIKTNGHNLKSGDNIYIDFLDNHFIVDVLDNYKIKIDSDQLDKPFINGRINFIPKTKIIKTSKSPYCKLNKKLDNNYEPFFSSYISSKICFEIIKLSQGILLPLEGWNHYKINDFTINPNTIIGIYGYNKELINKISLLNINKINIIDSNNFLENNLYNNIYQVNEFTNETIILCCINNYEQVIELDKIIYEKEIPLIFFEVDNLNATIDAVIPLETDRLINIYQIKKEVSYPECMIQNFPNLFEQTVIWAQERFEKNEREFNNLFHDNIIKLLEIYPDESFWTKGKLQPKPIIYNDQYSKFNEITDKIEWIHQTAVIRCKNYGIISKDINKTKEIITGIKENIFNIDSLISDMVIMEMIKYLDNNKLMKLEINMVNNNIIKSELKINKNIWNKFKCIQNYKLNEFIDEYNKLLQTNITMITCGPRIIYADFIPDNKDKLLSELINSENNIFSLSCDIENIDLPDIFIVI